MSWIRLDDQFPDHPKILAAGRAAAWLDICGLAYASRHRTDGYLPSSWIKGRDKKLAQKLVAVGRWEKVDGGYWIHDYLDFNPSRETVEHKSRVRREAAKAWSDTAPREGGRFVCRNPQQIAGPVPGDTARAKHHSPSPSPSPAPISHEISARSTGRSGSRAHESEEARRVLDRMNEAKDLAPRGYRPTDTNLREIAARLRDGASVDDCFAVVAAKAAEARRDSSKRVYFNPSTIFRAHNFERNLNFATATSPAAPAVTVLPGGKRILDFSAPELAERLEHERRKAETARPGVAR